MVRLIEHHQASASALASGWQVSSIIGIVSGEPFSIGSSSTSLNAPGNTQRGDQVKARVDILAMLFVTLRVIYIAMYVAGLPTVRSAVWAAALLANVAILLAGL